MILERKESATPYQDLYPNAAIRFEASHNDAINHVRTFVFRVYPSVNHFNRRPVAEFVLSFTDSSGVRTVFTDGANNFEFDTSTFSGYVMRDSEDELTPYTPQAAPQVVTMGYPKYDQIGYFLDELGSTVSFKNDFGRAWLLSQEFEGEALSENWELP